MEGKIARGGCGNEPEVTAASKDSCGVDLGAGRPDAGLARSVGRLFSATECQALLTITTLGFERDKAIDALVKAEWGLKAAVGVLVGVKPAAGAAAGEAARAPSPASEARASRPEGAGSGPPPVDPPAPPDPRAPLELGYVVLRTPAHLKHRRGHHRCDWGGLMMRFGIERSQWPRHTLEFYIRIFQNQEPAESLWSEHRLALPIPVDPETPETHIFMIEDNTPSSAGEAQSWVN